MKINKEVKIVNLKLVMLVLIGVLVLTSLVVFVVAQQDKQAELAQLESELSDLGYNWLSNYTLTSSETSSIEVYLKNGTELITTIANISSEGTYKTYLTGLGNLTSSDFDLKINSLSGRGIEFDWIVDPTLGVDICDYGDLTTQCNITTTHYLNATDYILSANNLHINGSGRIMNDSNIIFTINLTGNLTILSGGIINLTGASCSSGNCISGGNLTIVANVVNVSGKMLAEGGATTGSVQAGHTSGNGGIIVINASQIYVNSGSTISASSDDVRNAASYFMGGNGGTILINTTSINNSGTIKAAGGNGYSSTSPGHCTTTSGRRGNGGVINITTTTISNIGVINVEKGPIGVCDSYAFNNDGIDGQIFINNQFSPCNNGTILDKSTCQITKGIRVPNNEVIDFSGYNLTIKGGRLNADGEECTSGTCISGNNFTIIADIINLTSSGSISSDGGGTMGAGTSGNGGIITINASQIYVNSGSTISASSDDVRSTDYNIRGGNGGTILINTTSINNSGTIKSAGGNGRYNACGGSSYGLRGNGGIINITARSVISNIITANRGLKGQCNDGNGGTININSANSLNITNASATGNVSGTINLVTNALFVNGLLNATTETSSGINGTISLIYNSNINLSSAVIMPSPFISKNSSLGRVDFINSISGYASIDFNRNISITQNNIYVDSDSNSQALNRSANLTFYNVIAQNETEVAILRNGVVCPSNVCRFLEFSNSTDMYKFNVTSFSDYSLRINVTGCMDITQPGNYILTNSTIVNYPSTCINITASNVVFDGNGYTIDGGYGYINGPPPVRSGIIARGSSTLTNVTIRNVNINNFNEGIVLLAKNSLVINSSVNKTYSAGIYISTGSDYSQSINNTVTNAGSTGLSIYKSNYVNVTGGLYQGAGAGAGIGIDNSNSGSFVGAIIRDVNISGNPTGLSISYSNAMDNGIFYNNFFNNTNNVYSVAGANNYFNTTLQAGTNIIGGSQIHGNYWASPSGTNYSEVCADANQNGICDAGYNVTSQQNTSFGGYNIDSGALDYLYSMAINITYPLNATIHYTSIVDFNATIWSQRFAISNCSYSLNGGANTSMSAYNTTLYNYTYSGITHGYHNLTVSCYDAGNRLLYDSELNFRVNLLDLSVANVTLPNTVYTNATFIIINVSNNGPPNAQNVNVSCYLVNSIFDSKLIPQIDGAKSYITNCTGTFDNTDNNLLNVTVDPANTIAESNESNNYYLVYFNSTQLTNITISTFTDANTTQVIGINGSIMRSNGTFMNNTQFTITLNRVNVTSDTNNYSSFFSGQSYRVNGSNTLKLNFSGAGNNVNYNDDFSTAKYLTDADSYNSIGYSSLGHIFELDSMTKAIGNVSYHYTAPTAFYNATVVIGTLSSSDGTTGNSSILYSFNNLTWTIINSTTAKGATLRSDIPVDGKEEFYVMLRTNTNGLSSENPIDYYDINYTYYNYYTYGEYNSSSIHLPGVTYTTLKWDENATGGTVNLQLRESDDGSTWTAWSNSYTNHLDNSIAGFTKDYIQFRANLTTTNVNTTPILYSVNISFFNATTNATGGYNYNITIPTDSLGVLPLEVSVSPGQKAVGNQSVAITIRAVTSVPYTVSRNYTQPMANYSILVNFTRTDLSTNTNGSFITNISNSTSSFILRCTGKSQCNPSWIVPLNLSYGNYTINISAYNETGYFINSSAGYVDYLEQRNTTGAISVLNKTIGDFSVGNDYSFLWNASVNNTGKASMLNLQVYDVVGARSAGVKNVSLIDTCSRVYPDNPCNVTMNITMHGTANVGTANPHFISWRANWSDNDGSVSGQGSGGYISYTEMYVIIEGNSSLALSNYSVNLTMQHGTNSSFNFSVQSVGSTTVSTINLSFINETLNPVYVNVTPDLISSIIAGSFQEAKVNVTIPIQLAPGNYSGIINVSSANGGEKYINLTVEIPTNTSWVYSPNTNLTYNNSFALSTAGEIGNFTINNSGNINQTFAITYSAWGGTLYTDFGTAIFQENYAVGNVLMNPTLVNVSKGGSTVVPLYQKGRSSPLNHIGVALNIVNTTGSPTNNSVSLTFNLLESPPQVTSVTYLFNNVVTTIAEVSKNITIKVAATDDIDINASTVVINVTSPSGSITQIIAPNNSEFRLNGLNYIAANFTGNYTPSAAGVHNVSVWVFDSAGNTNTTSGYNFTAYSTTALAMTQNFSALNVSDADLNHKRVFYINYTVNNTGQVSAYSPNISFSANETLVISPVSYVLSNILHGANTSKVFQFNVSWETQPGTYSIISTVNYENPDSTPGSDSETFLLIVEDNKSMAFNQNLFNLSVPSGGTNSTTLIINNTGNVNLSSVSFSCYTGTLCGNFTVAFNDSSFEILRNSSRHINMSFTTSAGLTAGYYTGSVNVSEQNISKVFNVASTVPRTLSWTYAPTEINESKAAGSSGQFNTPVNISNMGNVDITFLLNSTNNSFITPNMSSITVVYGTNASFKLNFSAPTIDGAYYANISIFNESSSPSQINVSIKLTSTNLNVSILSPLVSNQATNVTLGDLVQILANATFEGVLVTTNSTWSATIGGSTCSSLNSSYDSSNEKWNITCNAPSLSDGVAYDLITTLSHDEYGEDSDSAPASVLYRDTSPPIFRNITRNNIALGGVMNLSVNVTDNVNVSSVIAYITYPNGTEINGTLISFLGFYNYTGNTSLTEAGEYLVNYTTNDTTGNFNSTADWFEVLDRYTWNNVFLNYLGSGVSGTNVSLLRPNMTTVLLNNVSNSSGSYSMYVNKRFYDIKAVMNGDEIIVRNVNFTNASLFTFNIHRVEIDELSETVSLHKIFDGISSNSTNLSDYAVNARFNYSGLGYDSVSDLEIVKCSLWNYSLRSCSGSWSALASGIDRNGKIVEGNSSGFSAYFLSEDKCGNGLCEVTYAETSTSCVADCVTGQGTTTVISTSSGGGGGGGGGGLKSGDLKKIEELIKSFLNVGGVKIETTSVYKELFAGDSTTFRIKLVNTLNSINTIDLGVNGDVANFISFESTSVELAPNEMRDLLVTIVVPKFTEPKNYDGDLIMTSGEEKASIPVTVRVLSPEGKLLDVKIQPLKERVEPGEILRLQMDLLNLGKTKKVDVQFDLQLIDADTGEIITRSEEAIAVETSFSQIKEFPIPKNTPLGKYLIKGVASYSSLEEDNQQATSIAHIVVGYPFYKKRFLFLPFWAYGIFILIIGSFVGGFYYVKWIEFRKKRFKTKVEFNKLPSAGANSGFVGKVAETGIRAFIDLNKLQMHTLVAGATGSGKTVAAQDIVEAALLHNKSVIIFDPTAQWTGFLRKSEDKSMLKRYKYFDMKLKEVRGFNGSIQTIRDPYEVIEIKKYLNRPGEITIFNVSHLSPKEIDVVVASTIEQVFKAEPEESSELKSLIVYDEVHRLLPKFGGSGQGFIQLERGAREFRKWGIGLVLISQVLSDFVGEVKANIGTEVQMGTRYEGDLERVGVKYGDDILKSLVKEPIGTGMVVNAEYNSGRPYFLSFRPLLHNTRRLSKEEITKYEEYFVEIEDLDFQTEELKKEKLDVLDLELELKLAKGKVKEGQFQMAEMYLESLRPRFVDSWKKLGKAPRHFVRKKIAREEVAKGIEEAKKERAKYIKKNPEKEVSFKEEIVDIKRKIEEFKKKGKDTSQIENKLNDLDNRLKPFKGKIGEKDAKGIKEEVDLIKEEVEKMSK